MSTMYSHSPSLSFEHGQVDLQAPVYIIGDIHGNMAALENLFSLPAIEPKSTFIFLGDYIDKGSQTGETVDFLFRLMDRQRVILIRGNHEYVWDRYLNHAELFRAEFLLKYGGVEALMNYEEAPAELIRKNEISKIRRHLREYLRLIEGCVDYVLLKGFLAIHAGIEPNQLQEDPLNVMESNFFIRPERMNIDTAYLGYYRVVAGHSFLGDEPFTRPGYLNIDCGAGYGKYLAAFDVHNGRIIRSDGRSFTLQHGLSPPQKGFNGERR